MAFRRILRVIRETSHPSRQDRVVLIRASRKALITYRITPPTLAVPPAVSLTTPAAPINATEKKAFRIYRALIRLPRIAEGGIGMARSISLSFASKMAPWA